VSRGVLRSSARSVPTESRSDRRSPPRDTSLDKNRKAAHDAHIQRREARAQRPAFTLSRGGRTNKALVEALCRLAD